MVTISCFGPGVRTENWMRLYNSLATSKVDFDLTIISPRDPPCELPSNFKVIKTNVKPAQCAEIGFRFTQGEFVMPVADDEIFSNEALDQLLELWKPLKNERALVSCRYKLLGQDISEGTLGANKYYVWQPQSPLAPICPLMKRETWQSIGGIDKRFIALYWDLDLAMRIYESGGIGVLHPTVTVEEYGECVGGGSHKLYDRYGPVYDRRMLDSFWTIPPNGQGVIQSKRLASVDSFEDKDILLSSQGPKGEW